MRYFHRRRVRLQVIVNPTGEDRRFHGCRPRLGQRFHPDIEVSARCGHFALLANLAAPILDAETDALLVYIQSDVIHMSFEEPPWLWSESTWSLSSALSTPRAPLGLSIQTAGERRTQRKHHNVAGNSVPRVG